MINFINEGGTAGILLVLCLWNFFIYERIDYMYNENLNELLNELKGLYETIKNKQDLE